MRIGARLAGIGLLACACGGEAAPNGSKQTGTPSECGRPTVSADAGSGACSVARAYVSCTSANGGCLCLSDDPTTCSNCAAQFPGPLTCVSQCAASEYAVSCGGPPQPGGGTTYRDVPAACHVVASTPGGSQYACCPCQ
ncbi:MAG: hypothetical protein ABUL62_01675 [Myxococcales bacterium]